MNILIDGRTIKPNPSGLGVWNLQLLRRLVQKKEIRVYLLLSKNCDYAFSDDNTLAPYINKQIHLIYANHNYRFVTIKRFLFEQFYLPSIIKKLKIDLFHATDSFGIPLFLPNKVKTLLTVHDLIPLSLYKEYLDIFQFLIYKLSLFIAAKKADKVVAISEKTMLDINYYLKIPKQKIITIYDGVDKSNQSSKETQKKAFARLSQQNNLSKNKYLLYYGGFGLRRNVPLLLKSFIELKKDPQFSEIKLVLSGRIKGAKEQALVNLQQIKKIVSLAKITKQVVFLEYLSQSQKEILINNCLYYISLSAYEGFGLGPIEAIRHGKPTLSSKPGILASFKEPNIYLLNNLDKHEIVKRMKLLAIKPLQETDFDKLKKFIQPFSWDKMADKYHALYLKMLNE